MTKFQTPNVPFVQANFVGDKHRPTALIIDLSETTSEKGAALGIANRLHKRNSPAKSHHYIVDEAETYRGVWDNHAAYNSPHRAISVLVCAQPVENVDMWEDSSSRPVLERTVDLVAKLLLAHKIRPRYLDADGETHWRKHRFRHRGGILINVRGAWPYEAFLSDVRSSMIT